MRVFAIFLAWCLVEALGQVSYRDGDTIVLEVPTRSVRRAPRQFPGFAPGWPLGIGSSFPGFPGFPSLQQPMLGNPVSAGPGQCVTKTGYAGECRQIRDCFPSLYDAYATPEMRSSDMMEYYQANSCGLPVLSNFLYYMADAEMRQSLVCCSKKKPVMQWPGLPAPPTRRPSGVVASWTTTTTPAPAMVTRNFTMGPIGGPGGHRPPTRRPGPPQRPQMTTPTTTTTTRRPHVWWTQPPTTTMRPNIWWTMPTAATPTTTKRPAFGYPPQTPTTQAPSVGAVEPQSCGVSRIVGGTTPAPGMYPWLVSIYFMGRHDCGGSLIDNTHVLTAAHCVQKYASAPHQVMVVLGAFDRSQQENDRIGVKVKRILTHAGFVGQHPMKNDIAMLTLASKVDIGARTPYKTICLPPASGLNYDSGSQYGWVAGWGGVAERSPPVNRLLHVKLRVMPNSECTRTYAQLGHTGITPTVHCAGNQGQDACQGDSGSPFIIRQGDSGPATQIGIVSWGVGCGIGPGVYTRVDKYLDWINRNRAIR